MDVYLGVGYGKGGIGIGSHFRGEMFDRSLFQEVAGHLGYGFPEQSHLSKMEFVEQLPSHELMVVYFNWST